MSDINRSKNRIDKTGEVFTPLELSKEILDSIPDIYFTDVTKTICEPSVGEGVFLTEILRRRLHSGNGATESLRTLYGVDLMYDNVQVCRQNLLDLAGDTKQNRAIVNQNIVHANSLEYDFAFA